MISNARSKVAVFFMQVIKVQNDLGSGVKDLHYMEFPKGYTSFKGFLIEK